MFLLLTSRYVDSSAEGRLDIALEIIIVVDESNLFTLFAKFFFSLEITFKS